jgi:hypothetical protein
MNHPATSPDLKPGREPYWPVEVQHHDVIDFQAVPRNGLSGVKLLPGTHHLFLGIGWMFLGTPKLFLGTFCSWERPRRSWECRKSERISFFSICVAAAFWQGREPTRGHGSRTAFPLFMFRCTCALVNARPPLEGTCSLPREPLLPSPPRFRDG